MKLALSLSLSALACGAGDSAPPSPATDRVAADWPVGTVLAVNDVPILASEVEELCVAVADLNPAWTVPHQRRLALTNVLLPRAAARSRYAEEWEAARTACRGEAERLRRGEAPSVAVETYRGGHRSIGLDLWSAARGRELGEWSEPLEVVGRWILLRLDTTDEPRRDLGVSAIVFRYVPGPEDEDPAPLLDAAWAESTTTFVDPAWSEYVPNQWLFRQKGPRS